MRPKQFILQMYRPLMEPLHERTLDPLLQFVTLLQFESEEYTVCVKKLQIFQTKFLDISSIDESRKQYNYYKIVENTIIFKFIFQSTIVFASIPRTQLKKVKQIQIYVSNFLFSLQPSHEIFLRSKANEKVTPGKSEDALTIHAFLNFVCFG